MGLLGKKILLAKKTGVDADFPQISAVILSGTVCVVYFASDFDDKENMRAIPSILFWSTMRLDLMVCLTALSALFCVRLSGHACSHESILTSSRYSLSEV
jgi:hypothetical protein